MKKLALVLVALAGCSSPFQAAPEALLTDAASDSRDEFSDPPSDAGEKPEASADAPSYQDQDSPIRDAGSADAPADVEHDTADPPEACAPAAFPGPAPVGCVAEPPPPSLGQLWVMQTEATPPWCRAFTLSGSENCERCASTYNCACLAPYLADAGGAFQRGTTGQGCVDTPQGPFFSE